MTVENKTSQGTERSRANARLAIFCGAFFFGMIGVAYASVPLYKLFCQVTGYGGTTQRVEQASERILDKTIKVRFDANTGASMPWRFQPKQRQVEIRIGETTQIAYEATNRSSTPVTGTATFNVTPQAAGAFFNKVECFCFTETTLQPGETLDMPVIFFIDPDVVNSKELKDISTITLSYTFFPVDGDDGADKNQTTENRNGNAVKPLAENADNRG